VNPNGALEVAVTGLLPQAPLGEGARAGKACPARLATFPLHLAGAYS